MIKVGFIGAGNMAGAMIKSLISNNFTNSIVASDINEDKLKSLRNELGISTTTNNQEVVDSAEMIVIAVKPQHIDDALSGIKVNEQIMISIAAGIPLSKLLRYVPRAVRVMPNTPALVGEMAGAYAFSEGFNEEEKKLVKEFLGVFGTVFELEEKHIDAVTALSGSGPGFLAYLLQGFLSKAVELGLNKDIAYELCLKTMKGTAELLSRKNLNPEDLIRMVASKGGTTEAGLKVLEEKEVQRILGECLEAAHKRSKELGKN
ncbi:pyrroline-5-carboxylate reductase [Candidatus Woesearchaeota archaeon]|nr:MAG: pyrroline-5-carboxylate reductase [Candidatus Woesearchaeota archaeon]